MKSRSSSVALGSDFDTWLDASGLAAGANATAAKRVIAWKVREAMLAQDLTKTELARRMQTSRAALDRLLDPDNGAVTLRTLEAAAAALGGRLAVDIAFPEA